MNNIDILEEKEKKAIKELTEIKELVEEDLKYKDYNITAALDQIDLESLVIVLNLIETLIAEYKELKENSIPKAKVQGLIDEINKAYEDSKDEYGESEYYYPDYTIEKLQSLLGKE